MNVSYDQAESLKTGTTIEGVSPQEVQEIINSVNESVAMEIQRSFDYFKATSSNERIDRIIITGGCSKVKGLPEFLSEKLGIPVERGNPFRNIVYNEKMFDSNFIADVSPMCAVAVGLAMRKVGDR
jgi:type IV pilus assembly protein PilM